MGSLMKEKRTITIITVVVKEKSRTKMRMITKTSKMLSLKTMKAIRMKKKKVLKTVKEKAITIWRKRTRIKNMKTMEEMLTSS